MSLYLARHVMVLGSHDGPPSLLTSSPFRTQRPLSAVILSLGFSEFGEIQNDPPNILQHQVREIEEEEG